MTQETHRLALETMREQITGELSAIAAYTEATGDWVAVPEKITETADENLQADTTEDWNERRALLSQLEIRLRNINRALSKIDAGTYGICEISGEPIEEERLTANPAARTNIANRDRENELSL